MWHIDSRLCKRRIATAGADRDPRDDGKASGSPRRRSATGVPLCAIVPRYMEREVLGAATPRNKTAGHGAGAIPHEVATAEAEGVVAAAASSIAYLAKKLP